MAEQTQTAITGRALRAAREFAGLSQIELGAAAMSCAETVSRFEAFDDRPIRCQPRTLMFLELTLKSYGVKIAPDGKSIHLIERAAA